jgi:hypothetical protein
MIRCLHPRQLGSLAADLPWIIAEHSTLKVARCIGAGNGVFALVKYRSKSQSQDATDHLDRATS